MFAFGSIQLGPQCGPNRLLPCVPQPITCHRNLHLAQSSHKNEPSIEEKSNIQIDSTFDACASSRRDALSHALTATVAVATANLLPSASASAASPSPPPPGTTAREAKVVMRVTALRGSVPRAWAQDFSTALEGYGMVALTQKPQVIDIWRELKGEMVGKRKKREEKTKSPTTADAVTLGDAWLGAAIVQGVIQPLKDAREYRYWKALSPRWRQLVSRSPSGRVDPSGQVWGVPYRWGCTAVLYRRDTASRWGGNSSRRITDWDDLLLPGLKNRIAFVDSPRELVGVALKTLGLTFNSTAAELAACGISEADLAARVRQLVDQVRVFSNVDHVRALAAGEVDVVVGWSDDLIPLEQRAPSTELAIPLSGTALFADLWCVPSSAAGGAEDGEPSPLLPAWLELALQPARKRSSLRGGASPSALPPAAGRGKVCVPVRTALEGDARLGDTFIPSEAVLSRSEFLLPVDASTAELYRRVLEAAST